MTDAFVMILANTPIAAAIGTAAWACARAGRPGTAHAIYLLALLELVTPTWLAVGAWSPAPQPPEVRRVDGALSTSPATVSQPASATAKPATSQSSATPPAPHAGAAPASSAPTRTLSAASLLAPTWALGALLLASCMLHRGHRFRTAVRGARPAPTSWQEEARALLPEVGLRRLPALFAVRADISPLVYPTLRGPQILLPEPLLAGMPAAQRQALLLHELAHVRRRDPWLRPLEVALLLGLWWHPLAWCLRAGLREAEEAACDAWVTAARPDARRAYAQALLAAADAIAAPKPPSFACGALRLDHWKQRMNAILTRPSRPRSGPFGRAAVAGVAALLPLGLLPAQPETTPATTTTAADDAEEATPVDGAQVYGAIQRPGWHQLGAETTVLEVVQGAEPTNGADLARLLLIRDTTLLRIDVRAMVLDGTTTNNVIVRDGDVLIVPLGPARGEATPAPRPLAIGDSIDFLIDPVIIEQGAALLAELRKPQGIDESGRILIPYVGRVLAAGLTIDELEAVVRTKLRALFATDFVLHARRW